MNKLLLWIIALGTGLTLGLLGVGWVNAVTDFVAVIYTRLFKFLSVPTIILAVITTLSTFGTNGTGKILGRTFLYTLLTTVAAALVAVLLFLWISPENLPVEAFCVVAEPTNLDEDSSYYAHILSVIPDNFVKPLLEGNVFSLLIIAFAVGIALSKMPNSENKQLLVKGLLGCQELLFFLIRGLMHTLPLAILAFSAQLSAQMTASNVAESIGNYVLVILAANFLQFFVVLPAFLLIKGINPVYVLKKMFPAVMMALFTKSSAATLPVTMQSAERRLGIRRNIARFVLPLCTTVNMNGCAAFIVVTSLFVMKNGGFDIQPESIVLWTAIAVFAAVGNAGVPMGCYFITVSLMSGIGAPVAVMGIILPVYAVIDMIETAENVWSDSCVAAMVDHDV